MSNDNRSGKSPDNMMNCASQENGKRQGTKTYTRL